MQIINREQFFSKIEKFNSQRNYLAMYSSWIGGMVTDPSLMMVPIDDHMVHRGDGVFEAIRVVNHRPYLMAPHIDRLFRSADTISIKISQSKSEIAEICAELIAVAKAQTGILRIFVGRGPGDFSANPYTTLGSQLYMVLTEFKPVAEEKYERGVSLMISQVPVKSSFYSQVKSLNYLPNVMMKMDSVDKGYDFAVNLTPEGFVAEGPTENLMIVDKAGHCLVPLFDYTLRGTTLIRVIELAKKNKIADVKMADVSREQLHSAQEIMMIGTTLEVLPVTRFENSAVGSGKVGPMAKKLRKVLQEDFSPEAI